MCLLLNWQNCKTVNLYIFLSALYMLWYVPIVIIFCNYIFIQKKKKKIPKLCHNTPLSIFSLGKGRESLCLKPYIKLITSVLSDLPPAHNDLDKASTMHLKIAQNMYIFSCKFCTFPVTEGNEIWHIYFQFMTPARKLTHNMKFEHFWMQKDTNFGNTIIIRHLGPENLTQKDTNFGNTIIICHLGPENHQNQTQKDTKFKKMHSLTPAKLPTNKESIRFSRILHHNSNALINPIQH